MLGGARRRLVRELNLLGRPLTSRDDPKRIEEDCHAVFILLPGTSRRVCQQEAKIAMLAFDTEPGLGRLVVDMEVTLGIVDSIPHSRGIEDYIDEGTDILRVKVLAEVHAETFISGCARSFLQDLRKGLDRNKAV